jgi:hypothetical protein
MDVYQVLCYGKLFLNIRHIAPIFHITTDAESAFDVEVPGVLVSAEHYTLPTDAVFLEAVLGENIALDTYAKESLKTVALENDRIEAALGIVNSATDKAEAFEKVFAPCCPDCTCGGQHDV